jgi:hypothetical protein
VKKLIVGTVYASDNETQQRWLDLQLRYLKATTEDFDHVAVVASGITNSHFHKMTKVLVPEDRTLHASEAHVSGLNLLLSYFREREDEYQNFLFLDGDAFPIRKQWLGSLLYRMEPQQEFDYSGVAMPRRTGSDYDVAVILRSENLETRLHASVTFVKKSAMRDMSFKIGVAGQDLLCRDEEDIHIPAFQFYRRKLAFPLIRSNQYNVHPLACGVYFDMFYHHSCGSGRWFNLRGKSYYDRIVQPVDSLDKFTNQLFSNPTDFVGKLAGWSPSRYPTAEELNDGKEEVSASQ